MLGARTSSSALSAKREFGSGFSLKLCAHFTQGCGRGRPRSQHQARSRFNEIDFFGQLLSRMAYRSKGSAR